MARRIAAGFLTDTCDILRSTSTTTAEGYPEQSWGTAGTAVRCRINEWERTPDRTGEIAMQERTKEFYYVILPYDQSVQSGDKIRANSVSYEVVQYDTSWTDIVTRRVYAVRMP